MQKERVSRHVNLIERSKFEKLTEQNSTQVSIRDIKYIYPSTDSERSVQEVTVTSGKVTVVEFNQTVAESGNGFQGYKINPRNLTLWINSTGHLDVAIAQLGGISAVVANF